MRHLFELAKIVRAAGHAQTNGTAEGIVLEAIADGFRRISADCISDTCATFGARLLVALDYLTAS